MSSFDQFNNQLPWLHADTLLMSLSECVDWLKSIPQIIIRTWVFMKQWWWCWVTEDYYYNDDDDDLNREDDLHDAGSCSRHLSTQRRQANLYANAWLSGRCSLLS